MLEFQSGGSETQFDVPPPFKTRKLDGAASSLSLTGR